MPSTARILDASANRAREALRVMEDAARFLLDDPQLTAALKRLRHDLAGALRPFDTLEFNRDTPRDVGRGPGPRSELSRASAAEVVIAAGKRLSEALRSLEEYGKTIDPAFGAAIGELRYRGYDLEQRLNRAVGSGLGRQWSVCVILSEAMCAGRSWSEVAEAICAAGPDCIQLREKDLDDAELLRRARQLVQMAPRSSVVINDRPDVALICGAHGVHLGQRDLSCAEVRKTTGRQLLIGVSTSNLDEAEQAVRDGADYCGLGPMFETSTKATKPPVGPEYARRFVERFPDVCHLAIGGISPDNVEQLAAAGVRGVAVCSAVCAAKDPGRVIRSLQEAMDPARRTPTEAASAP